MEAHKMWIMEAREEAERCGLRLHVPQPAPSLGQLPLFSSEATSERIDLFTRGEAFDDEAYFTRHHFSMPSGYDAGESLEDFDEEPVFRSMPIPFEDEVTDGFVLAERAAEADWLRTRPPLVRRQYGFDGGGI